MLVWPHRPDYLEGEQVLRPLEIPVPVLALKPQEDELALPPSNGRREPPLGVFDPAWCLGIIVSDAQHPTRAASRLQIQKRAIPVRRRTQLRGTQPVSLGPEGDVPPGAGLGWPVGEPKVQADKPALKIGFGVVPPGRREAELGVAAATELPEVLHSAEEGGLTATSIEWVALRRGPLEPHLVGPAGDGKRQRAVERQADAAQALLAEEPLIDQRVLGFRQRVEVPAVEVADLLAELPDIQTQMPWQRRPIDVTFLHADLLVLEGEEDLGLGERIQRRLEGELELPGHAVVLLRTRIARDQADVSCGAYFRVQQVGAPGTSTGRGSRLGVDRTRRGVGGLPSRRRRGGGTDRGEITRGVGRRRSRRRRTGRAPGGDHAFQPTAEPLNRGAERVERRSPTRARLHPYCRTPGTLSCLQRVQPGSQAEQDSFERVGSCLGRLLRYEDSRNEKQRDGQPWRWPEHSEHDRVSVRESSLGALGGGRSWGRALSSLLLRFWYQTRLRREEWRCARLG